MLKMCIILWFLIIFTNLFQGTRISLNALTALNEVLRVPYTYSTQTTQSITYSGTRVYNTVNIRRCKRFVTFKYRLKTHILTNNGGQFAMLACSIIIVFFFLVIEFQLWFMTKEKLSTLHSQINRIVLILSGINFTLIILLASS